MVVASGLGTPEARVHRQSRPLSRWLTVIAEWVLVLGLLLNTCLPAYSVWLVWQCIV